VPFSVGPSAALLVLSLLCVSACSASSPGQSATPSSSPDQAAWVSVTEQTETVRPEELNTDRPKRIAADADLCALLTEREVTAVTGAPHARTGRPVPGALCMWQIGDAVDDRGTPVQMLTLTSAPLGGWLGEEQGVIDGYPTRRRVGDDFCVLKVGLRHPDAPTDRVVLAVHLRLADKATAPCPAAQTLAESAVSRVPGA
jgi:hypothetical protein